MDELSARITRTNGMNSGRAGCVETRTSGSEGGPRKRTERNLGTAPRSDPYSYCRVGDSFWYLIAIIDMFSRKIVGHAVRPSATSDDVKDTFDKALANEGLLVMDAKMPASLSDRGPQMRSKTIRRFFYDLGIKQMFSRPRTPADNATIESFFATIKGERLYHGTYSNPIELASDADAFVIFYNEARLHMGIGFVTPAEKHDGRADGIIAARKAGMKRAREERLQVNRGCSEGSDAA